MMLLYRILSYTPFALPMPLSALSALFAALGLGLAFRRRGGKLSLLLFLGAATVAFLLLLCFCGEALWAVLALLLCGGLLLPRPGKGGKG